MERVVTVPPVDVGALRRRSDPSSIPFDTTAEVTDFTAIVGQDRAVEALEFGIAIRREGYNLFAIGPAGTGKQTLIRQYLESQATTVPGPGDVCYVQNFADAQKPRALHLPRGAGVRLRDDMQRLVADLEGALPSAFGSDEYRTRRMQIVSRFKVLQEALFEPVARRAKERNVAVIRAESGVVIAAIRDDEPLSGEQFEALPEEERTQLGAAMEATRQELAEVFLALHEAAGQERAAVKVLDLEVASAVTKKCVDSLRQAYADLPSVLAYLEEVEKDVVASTHEFLDSEEGLEATVRRAMRRDRPSDNGFRRYRVNVVIDNSGTRGAPIVYEDNPTHANLVGRVEHLSDLGTLVTDFTLIKPGALHRAAGGYLVVEAIRLLQQPFAWDALKRSIRAKEIRVESMSQLLGLVSTVSLEPEAIPLGDMKVVLVGERILYYLLATVDPDFLELFKVLVDFEDDVDRTPASTSLFSRLLAAIVRKEGLLPFDRTAIAAVLDHAARLCGDSEKLSIRMRPIADLVRESDHFASRARKSVVTAADVVEAICAQRHRADRIRERLLESIRRDTIYIDTTGTKIGQVNGLSVIRLGALDFGQPTRITARVRVGKGDVVDIEREVALGGPIHSKGVLILVGFIGARYARRAPLSLSASLVFEQSYGGVDGDSASLAELCALLSALAEAPIRQSFAVTGSIDQLGRVQPIGGVNEKIEGFFDVCRDKGLSGEQAVIIPRTNVKNLMLREDVVDAVREGMFQIYGVDTVDEAFELLVGRDADAFNGLVEARLGLFAEDARAFVGRPTSE